MTDEVKTIQKLKSGSETQRYAACEAIRVSPSPSDPALQALVVALGDPSSDVRDAARRAVGVHLPGLDSELASQVVPLNERGKIKTGMPDADRLIQLLGNRNPLVRKDACDDLARLTDVPNGAIRELHMALKDEDPLVRSRARAAILAIGDRIVPDVSEDVAPEAATDELVICPYCAEQISAAWKFCSFCGKPLVQAPVTPGNKLCPYCGEQIKLSAVFCRYCRKDLPQPAPASHFPQAASVYPVQLRPTSKRSVLTDDYTKSTWWYARGRFGGLALLLSFVSGWYGISVASPTAILACAVAGLAALFLLGGKGILWTLLVWGILGLIALLSQ